MQTSKVDSCEVRPTSKVRVGWLLAGRTAVSYAILASVWILTSDLITSWFTTDPQLLTVLSVAKGLFFVVVTAGLLAVLIRRDLAKLERALNQQQLLTAGAETLGAASTSGAAWFGVARLIGDYAHVGQAEVWRLRDDQTLEFDGLVGLQRHDPECGEGDELPHPPESVNRTISVEGFELSSAWHDALSVGRTVLADGSVPKVLRRGPHYRSVEILPVGHEDGTYGAILLWRRRLRGLPPGDLTAVRQVLRNLADTQLKFKLQESLEHSALYDSLTGLPNRTLFVDRLQAALVEARIDGTKVLVLRSHLDLYDRISQSMGAEDAERLVLEAAKKLGDLLGPRDTLAYTQSAEFKLIVRYTTPLDVSEFIERFSKVAGSPLALSKGAAPLSLSTGAYLASGADHVDEVQRDVAAALSRAQLLGRGRIVYFDEGMRLSVEDALHTEVELREGLEREEFETFFQPFVDSAQMCPFGAEALVRWRHRDRGLVSPAEFIPIAEESGLIVELGRRVLRDACMQCASWPSVAGREMQVSVNLSAVEFLDDDLEDSIHEALAESGLDPSRLQIEVTETALMLDPDQAQETISSLREIGIQIALDDFGTKYSSLTYLQRFDIDMLKIDASFVAGLEQSQEDSAIAKAVIQLAHSLGLAAVAEGVETEAQRDYLRDQGCDYLQGYLIGKPVDAAAFSAWLEVATCGPAD